MIFISIHALFTDKGEPVHGTGSEIVPLLVKKQIPFIRLLHSISNGHNTLIEIYTGDKKKVYRLGFTNIPFFIRVIQEQIITAYILFTYRTNIPLYIGIDPLNALSGIFYKKIYNIKKIVFYTADYAYERFPNKLMNTLYHTIDKYCMKNADDVWNVSKRIYQLRMKQGLSKNRNLFLPNTPDLSKIILSPFEEVNRFDLVIVSHLTPAIEFKIICEAIEKLSRKYSEIKLFIIGQGPSEKNIRKMINEMKLEKHVFLLGKKNHDEVITFLRKCGVGLAIYTSEKPWTMFGDSMKVREYAACGLPCILTDVPSTAEDVKEYNAGVLISMNRDELFTAIDSLLKDKKEYLKIRNNAIRLGHAYDFAKIFEKRFNYLMH